jgi:hypothetical protein
MGLLDDLKKQASSLLEEQQARLAKEQRQVTAARERVAGILKRVHAYLHELVEQLRVVDPDIRLDLPVKGGGVMRGLRQGNYLLSDPDEVSGAFSLRYELSSKRRFEFDIQGATSVQPWLDSIKAQGLEIYKAQMLSNSGAGTHARVTVEGTVPVAFLFSGEPVNGSVVLSVQNYDELATRRHVLAPETIDEGFLDELARYILRENNKFLVQELPDEYKEKLRKRIEHEKREKERELGDGGEMLSSRFKTLFKRRPNLRLSCADKFKEMSAFSTEITLGRGSTCDLVVNASHVSRAHAKIERREDGFLLVDQSTNGTFVSFEDGRSIRLHKDSVLLGGRGLIGLGAAVEEGAPHVIRFEA